MTDLFASDSTLGIGPLSAAQQHVIEARLRSIWSQQEEPRQAQKAGPGSPVSPTDLLPLSVHGGNPPRDPAILNTSVGYIPLCPPASSNGAARDAVPVPGKRHKLWTGTEEVANFEQILLMVQAQSDCFTNFEHASDSAFNRFKALGTLFHAVRMASPQTIKNLFAAATRMARGGTIRQAEDGSGGLEPERWHAPPMDHLFPSPGVPLLHVDASAAHLHIERLLLLRVQGVGFRVWGRGFGVWG